MEDVVDIQSCFLPTDCYRGEAASAKLSDLPVRVRFQKQTTRAGPGCVDEVLLQRCVDEGLFSSSGSSELEVDATGPVCLRSVLLEGSYNSEVRAVEAEADLSPPRSRWRLQPLPAVADAKDSAIRDDYQLRESIGEGSFATVFRATSKRTGEVVAVKSMELDGACHVELELSAWRGLRHPHVVRLHAAYHQAGGDWHMVMDYCPGGDLHGFVTRYVDSVQRPRYGGGLSAELAGSCMRQMLIAVAYVHSQGVIHRDLKPENFLLASRSTRAPFLRLADFGFAGRFRPGERLYRKLGTQFYAAPELLAESYDQRADLWSLGVTGYVVCTWHLPFEGFDEEAYDANAAAGRRRAGEDRWWAEHEPRMRGLVNTCLNLSPEQRPAADDLLAANPWLEECGTKGSCVIA